MFGQIKERQGLRRFVPRGLAKVTGEWTLWCLTHNLRQIMHARRATPDWRLRLVGA
ncbi:MAG: transposase [Chloroflexi bacterium]|nr:transposase [Chloroflexota bacterium]